VKNVTRLGATRHSELVQFLFYLMKRNVADLIVRAHGENGRSVRPEGYTMYLTMHGANGVGSVSHRLLSQICRQLPA